MRLTWQNAACGSTWDDILCQLAVKLQDKDLLEAWQTLNNYESTWDRQKTISTLASRLTDRELLTLSREREVKLDLGKIIEEIRQSKKSLINIKNLILVKELPIIQRDALHWWRDKITYLE